ncbi:MAG: methyltransferase [Alphaproteobacteria bacterium]|nr:MAG: methyltransferase [Alphaproteobacteria bacterium]
MTALETYLIKLIKAQGPITIATFMAEALGNPRHGYYMKQDPFGRAGDFITAPEISQMFGEMVGLWQAVNWMNMGRPEKIHLIEIGPGRGTLMQDALRSLKAIPGMMDALEIHLVEMSPKLKTTQAETLKDYKIPTWHSRIGDVLSQAKGAPILLIANEFFDALPVRQFQKTGNGWHERLVSLDDKERLSLRLAPAPSPEHLIPSALHRADVGSIAEVCSIGDNIMAEIAEHIQQSGGAALVIDYGHDAHGTGDTLQAVKAHKYVDILSEPGDVDLTTHVNFQRLKEVAHACETRVHGPTGQGVFLKALGIDARAETLSTNASEAQKSTILAALHRLTDDGEMGNLFKVMAVTDQSLSGVIGFEE